MDLAERSCKPTEGVPNLPCNKVIRDFRYSAALLCPASTAIHQMAKRQQTGRSRHVPSTPNRIESHRIDKNKQIREKRVLSLSHVCPSIERLMPHPHPAHLDHRHRRAPPLPRTRRPPRLAPPFFRSGRIPAKPTAPQPHRSHSSPAEAPRAPPP